MPNLLNGKTLAATLRAEQKQRVETLTAKGTTPGLAVVRVGDDPASEVYVRNKAKMCQTLGIRSEVLHLPADTEERELLALIDRLNQDPAVHGILVQLPLPPHINEARVTDAIAPPKDVDGFGKESMGALLSGKEGFVPCTPKGILRLLKETGLDLAGKKAVVVGRSNIVGKPVALLLLAEHCTVTLCHSKTKDLAAVTKEADILIAAVGRPRMLGADHVKEGAVVIDVGINRLPEGLVGDVDFEAVSDKAAWITPVPGGVGPMTIAMLMENTIEAAEAAHEFRA
ncbi:MAG: bifunctional methylenetetrahydrofolate dehydrogenase/methenyltetrahydrofolate cyclohydrolase FolD [Clostridia bacterium]|nr:bifunctional methylenetetrahydrofolate dehydrogenase/methenyltetrahydrofolate cyclohydrolase FolD [Clostridia bacterium]